MYHKSSKQGNLQLDAVFISRNSRGDELEPSLFGDENNQKPLRKCRCQISFEAAI